MNSFMDTTLPWPTVKARRNPPSEPPKPVDQRYSWKVIADPSGDFLGRQFQVSDLVAGSKQDTWPENIVFENLRTGERCRYEGKGNMVHE